MSRFYGFEIPDRLANAEDLVEKFIARADLFNRGPAPVHSLELESWMFELSSSLVPCSADCTEDCAKCLNNLSYTDGDDELRGIARFEALEWWLEGKGLLNPGLYRRPRIKYRGLDIIDNIFRHTNLLQVFIHQDWNTPDCWCAPNPPCSSPWIPEGIHECNTCIYCSNVPAMLSHEAQANRRAAFANYVEACGFNLQTGALVGVGVQPPPPPPPVCASNSNPDYQPLQPTVEPPEHMPACSDFRRTLEMFNNGFACWCDPRASRCQQPHCSRCTMSEAAVGAVDAFARWAAENGWEVTRGALKDTYAVPADCMIPPAVDYSMQTGALDNPLVCPRLEANYLVHLDTQVEGRGSKYTSWLMVWGLRDKDRPEEGYSAVELQHDGSSIVKLGYAFRLHPTVDCREDFTVAYEHIDAVVPLHKPGQGYGYVNAHDLIKWMQGVEKDEPLACWKRAEE